MLESYNGFLLLGFMGVFLMSGIFLRAKLKFLQSYLVPSAIIGGILGFIFINTVDTAAFLPFTITSKDYMSFTLHAFNFSFMSLALTGNKAKVSFGERKEYFRGSLWMSSIWATSLALQAIAGAAIILLYNSLTGGSLATATGFLVAHGFTQGPGQGFAYGTMWAENYGLSDFPTLGLIFANIGFLVSFCMGVPLARHFIRKKLNINKQTVITDTFLKGIYRRDEHPEMGKETTHPANVETLAVHIAVMGIAYLMTYLWLQWATVHLRSVPYIGVLFQWELFFLHGLIICLLIRKTMTLLRIDHLLDNSIQRHLTGLAVDLMLVASFMSVTISVLKAFLIPIILVSVAASIVTFFLIYFAGKNLNHLSAERTITQIGCCCGSTANGLLLLKILDPDYSSGVAMELAFFNVAIVFLTLPSLTMIAPVIPALGFGWSAFWYGVSGILTFGMVLFLGFKKITVKK